MSFIETFNKGASVVTYPTYLYHRDLPAIIVKSKEEHEALGAGWEDSPSAFSCEDSKKIIITTPDPTMAPIEWFEPAFVTEVDHKPALVKDTDSNLETNIVEPVEKQKDFDTKANSNVVYKQKATAKKLVADKKSSEKKSTKGVLGLFSK